MKAIRWVLRALIVAIVSIPAAQAADSPAPNIVLILADDMGYGDPRCYDPASKIPTPSIDRLAAQGMRFTDAHSPTSVCSPTRYAILTGRYAWRSALKSGVLVPYDPPLIEKETPTLAGWLRSRGYRTGCIGKWHLGWRWARKDETRHEGPFRKGVLKDADVDLTQPAIEGPDAAGFDEYFGTDVPNYPPYCFLENGRIVGPTPDRPKPDDVYGNPGRIQEGWRLEAILPTLERKAVEFIETRAAEEPRRPFFLYFPLTAPHTPIVPSKPYQGHSQAGDYGDLVVEVDHAVGAVLNALDRSGVADNTLVFFTSDNGSPARAGDPHIRGSDWAATGAVTRLFGHNPNAPWRGMKSDAWEGGHRVPFIVRWPGKVSPGSVNESPICHVDIFATVVSALDGEPPSGFAKDSVSLLPTLAGPKAGQPVRSSLIHHSGNGMFAVRRGRWKLILGLGSGGFTRPARIQPAEGEPPGQLYDLSVDPGETKNVYADHPDVVEQLRRLLEASRAERS